MFVFFCNEIVRLLLVGGVLAVTRWVKNYPGGAMVRNPPTNAGDAGDTGLIPGWRISEFLLFLE